VAAPVEPKRTEREILLVDGIVNLRGKAARNISFDRGYFGNSYAVLEQSGARKSPKILRDRLG
jgi:hypothetical protein